MSEAVSYSVRDGIAVISSRERLQRALKPSGANPKGVREAA